MAPVPVPNTVEVELRYLLGAQNVENTLYFERTAGAWDVGAMAGLASDLATWFATDLAPQLVSAIALREIYMTDLSSDTAPTYSLALSPPIAGEKSGDPLPNNCALTVSFRSAGRGRSSRGRNYVCGLGDTDASGSIVSSTVADAIRDAYAGLIGVAGANSCDWVVVSRFLNNVARVTGATFPIVAAVVVDLYIDSQRRRLPGRGT